MYKAIMTIPGPLPKHCIYNTNKSFRTCAKVMYYTRAKALYFPRPVVFPLVYAFIHA